MAIQAAFIFNNHGKPRLTRFYTQLPIARQQALIQRTFRLVHKRTSLDNGREVCNFLDAPELRAMLPASRTASIMTANRAAEGKGKRSDKTAIGLMAYDEDADDLPTAGPSKKASTSSGKARKDPLPDAHDDQLRVIYRHYATLYFVFIVDESESELGILDLIQVFVEALDRVFENVCELDLIFHFDEVHMVLNEIIQGGLVLETNLSEIVTSARAVAQARRVSAASPGVVTPGMNMPGGGMLGLSYSPFGSGNTSANSSLPWAGAADWARDLGSRLTSGASGTSNAALSRTSRRM